MNRKKEIHIYEEGKIDVHKRELRYQRTLQRFRKEEDIIHENKQSILVFLRDCSLGKTVIGKAKKKIGAGRCLKYLGMLQQLSRWFNKSFDHVTQEEMETLVENLENDSIQSAKGRPFSEATKADIKKTIKKFWKWKDGQNKHYPDLVAWIDSSDPVKDVPALSRTEVEKMIEHTSNPRDKALLMVFFDSGARVEELLNVRLKPEHLFWKEDLACFMIRLEFSKTRPRTISLPLSTTRLANWLEHHPARDNPQAQLFPLTYGNLRMLVHRIGKRVLNKRVSPHILRHSSATFYANKLRNPYKLCYRYGWTMASDMVNRYLDREGILEEETAQTVNMDERRTTERRELALQEELIIVRESLADVSAKFKEVHEEIAALKSGKGILKLLLKSLEPDSHATQALNNLGKRGFDYVLKRDVENA